MDQTGWVSVGEGSGAEDWQLAVGDLLERDCPTCADGHKRIVYKRLTDGGDIDFKNLFLHQVTGSCGVGRLGWLGVRSFGRLTVCSVGC